MATEIEEMRQKLAVTVKERTEFAATFSVEKLPTEDDERKLDAMMNGEADLRGEILRVEKFAGAKATGAPPPPVRTGDRPQLVTLGQRFVGAEQYKQALTAFAPNGRIPEGGHFNMPSIEMNGLLGSIINMKAALITGDSSTSAGAFVITQRDPELIPLGRKPLRIFEVISRMPTDSDLVDYVAESARTNAAATRAEPTATGDNSGVAAESAFTFEVRQAAVKNVANWFPVTKQGMADVPQMQGIVDEELRDNLLEKLCDLIINGLGTGSQFTGIVNTSGTQTQAWSTNILTTTRKAKTIVGTVGREVPNAYLLNPAEWEIIDLLQDNEARYFYGGPAQVGVPRLWGLPVVEEEAVVAGTGLVGNFMKARLWDRQQATLSISDSHQDFFTRGLLALLADLRVAFALRKPTAVVEMDLTA